MPITDPDKHYLNSLVERAMDRLRLKDDGGDRENQTEFLLHLYDALWENMRAKENRLWTFLSLYGAAVGLVFAGGQASQSKGADLFVLIIVMALTVWAVLIVLNANWWYYRNQLMVTRIESRLPDAVKGVVPKLYYEDPVYRFDRLYKSSILVLGILVYLLYVRTIWSYHNMGAFDTVQSLLAVLLLYVLFVCSTMYCLAQHEATISLYYSAKRDLFKEGNNYSPNARLSIVRDENKARKAMSARPHVLLLLLLVGSVFDLVLYRNGVNGRWLVSLIITQSVAILFFCLQWHNYRRELKATDSLKAAMETMETLLWLGDPSQQNQAELVKQITALNKHLDAATESTTNVKTSEESKAALNDVKRGLTELKSALAKKPNNASDVANKTKETEELLKVLQERVVQDIEGGLKEGKGALSKAVDLGFVLAIFITAFLPGSYFGLKHEKIQKDWRGEEAISVEEIGTRLDKAREDFKSIQDSYERLKQSSGERQQRELDERFGRYLEKREAQESYVTKDELETRIPAKSDVTSGGKANQ